MEELLQAAEPLMDDLFARCIENAPNFGVRRDCFKDALRRAIKKFLSADTAEPLSSEEVSAFLNQIQIDDLFLALACANGNERAWWEFDQQHRSYLERVARHLAKTEVDAQEVIDSVYV